MLFYPPGDLLQRGEDRCQAKMDDSTAQSMRAANDLGYAASMLREKGFEIYLKDFQTEKLAMNDLITKFKKFNPDVIFVSVTTSSIFSDLEKIRKLKEINPNLVVVIKGALLFDPPEELLDQLDLRNINYLIGGESDFIVGDLVHSHFFNPSNIPNIRAILYRENGKWIKTDFSSWENDLDSLKFPDRNLMNNSLYLRPDTGEPMATISTSRGCAGNCIYCLTPTISGKKVRVRSPENIFEELKECYYSKGIRNFFFKSDAFTMNGRWVKSLCNYIVNSELNGKIEWAANSRVNPLEPETLIYMKKAGCWLIAFGFESGSTETLEKTKKGATVEDNRRAAEYAKKAGLKIFGFYLIGLPWENMSHLEATRKLIFEIDSDFVELHLAIPYYGTALYEMVNKEGLMDKSNVLGKDIFDTPAIGTKYLSVQELQKFRKKVLLKYHLRLPYIIRKFTDVLFNNPKALKNYFKYGVRLLRKNI